MAEDENIFLRAQQRTYKGLTEDKEKEWKGPFYFIQAADPQLGLMKAWRVGDCDEGGDEWYEEVQLTKQAVQAINKLQPQPRFVALCGDLVHAMPGSPFREEQERDLKEVLLDINPNIPLVFVSGNHDLAAPSWSRLMKPGWSSSCRTPPRVQRAMSSSFSTSPSTCIRPMRRTTTSTCRLPRERA